MVSMLEVYKKYTYSDYVDWGDGNRCELIDGIVYMVSAPNIWHQRVAGRIYSKLTNALDGKFVEAKFERGENGIELEIVTLQVRFTIIT